MSAHATSPSVIDQLPLIADARSKHSLGRRLIGLMMAARQRSADRHVHAPTLRDPHYDEFRIELERRLLGQ